MQFWANMNGELNRAYIRLILLDPLSREGRKDGKNDKEKQNINKWVKNGNFPSQIQSVILHLLGFALRSSE